MRDNSVLELVGEALQGLHQQHGLSQHGWGDWRSVLGTTGMSLQGKAFVRAHIYMTWTRTVAAVRSSRPSVALPRAMEAEQSKAKSMRFGLVCACV